MSMGNDRLFPILAIIIMIVGIFSTAYVTAITNQNKIDENTIIINDIEFSKNDFFKNIQKITITTDRGQKTGYALEDIIIKSGVLCPQCNKYTFKALEPDPYQQTVSWEDIKTGIFTLENNRVYFPDLTHSFWVYNVIEIEVE